MDVYAPDYCIVGDAVVVEMDIESYAVPHFGVRAVVADIQILYGYITAVLDLHCILRTVRSDYLRFVSAAERCNCYWLAGSSESV